jgi:hypothetical protein
MTKAPPIADRDTLRPTLLCFAGDLWDGNPHSRHHLMRRYAERYDVLFVESVPMRSLALGGEVSSGGSGASCGPEWV